MTMSEDLLVERKIELLVNIQTKAMQKEIAELRKIIVVLNDEVAGIKQQMKSSARLSVYEEPPRPEANPVVKCVQEESHHRTGDYKPGDVDIKKIFYFGNK